MGRQIVKYNSYKAEKDVGGDGDKSGEIYIKYSIFEVENHWRKGASG